MTDYKIAVIPDETLDINDDGLKNLAAWLARYTKFGVLNREEHSTFIVEALNSGSLAHFEPTLTERVGRNSCYHWGDDAEYEKYEFSVRLCLLPGVAVWLELRFQFKSDDKALMYTLDCTNSRDESSEITLDETKKTFSKVLGVEIGDESEEITWLEADEIILKYVKYMNALSIQPPPSE